MQPSVLMISAVAVGEVENAVTFAQTGYDERDAYLVLARHSAVAAEYSA